MDGPAEKLNTLAIVFTSNNNFGAAEPLRLSGAIIVFIIKQF